MRGSPPIQLFLVVLALVGVAIPLLRLTGKAAISAPMALKETVVEKTVTAHVCVRFVHKPETLSMKLEGRELVEKAVWGEQEVEFDAKLPTVAEMVVSATWTYGAPNQAMSIEISPDGKDMHEKTVWSSSGSLSEVVLFQW